MTKLINNDVLEMVRPSPECQPAASESNSTKMGL